MNYKLLIIVSFLPFFFSCQVSHKKSNLERALELAGANRPELEKVLEHYRQNPENSLKYKAAVFLIENMDTYFFTSSPELESYYKTVDSIFSLNATYDTLTTEQDALLSHLGIPDLAKTKWIPDIQYVSADFLTDNIDEAFEAWRSPFAKGITFNDFCEYLLPYKVNSTDRPEKWRSVYKNIFYPLVMSENPCRTDSGLIYHSPSIALTGDACRRLPENLFDSAPEFTVSCRVNLTQCKPNLRVFDFGKNNDYYLCFIPCDSFRNGNATLELRTDKIQEFIVYPDSLPVNRFVHIAVSYSKNSVLFYINGLIAGRRNIILDNKKFIDNKLGISKRNAKPGYLNGTVDDLRIYNRKLTDTEIGALAQKSKDSLNINRKLQEILWKIKDLYAVNIIYKNILPGGYAPTRLINLKKGTCNNYTVLSTYIYRSLGIPAGIEYVSQWADRSMGHDWNVICTGADRREDYSSSALWDTLGCQVKSRTEKKSKIYRETFAKQKDSPAMQNKNGEVLPPFFNNPCFRDVTDSYLDCIDVTISLTRQSSGKGRHAWLCTFNNHDWIPVHWGVIKGGKAVFTKMGRDIAYLPVYYDRYGIRPAADPFILTKEGEIRMLIPDRSKTRTLILKRKYRPFNALENSENLLGCRFQVANKADFSDSLTVYTVNIVPEIRYNLVNLALKKPYRYFRFLAPPYSRGGKISEIEIYSPDSAAKLQGKIIASEEDPEAKNAFDGDPLTSYESRMSRTGCVGIDFGKPMNLSYFRYLPRNDDNFIKEGEEYELFYWENYKWNSLGKQTGTSKQYLEYPNAPSNALFWLRNLTKGKEERIFTYKNGQQVWW